VVKIREKGHKAAKTCVSAVLLSHQLIGA
jgi:hypothetical protein